MIDYSDFFAYLQTTAPKDAARQFAAQTQKALNELSHGDFDKWAAAITAMPNISPSQIDLNAEAVTIVSDIDETTRKQLSNQLMRFHPWRKGPFNLFGIHIDTEWRSDLKWARLQVNGTQASSLRHKRHGAGRPMPTIDLKDKLVLDVGCGNGYYLFRMLGAGAKAAVGVDPFMLSVMQFHAINKYVQTNHAAVLPLGVDAVPQGCGCFDTVFSMGLLYHRREPKEHLAELLGFLKPGGQLVLETLVLDRPDEAMLKPRGRYAKMRNVWSIPSPKLLEKWLTESGYDDIQIADITKTTATEQRKTGWMTYESLDDFLDPADPAKTIEGHPAPVRAIVLAAKPS